MKRSHSLNRAGQSGRQEISRETAIHEAGHAAGIYFGNRQKGLPVVFFQIDIQSLKTDLHPSCLSSSPKTHCAAKIEGGRLIHTVPCSFAEATKNFTAEQKRDYECAFKADIFNFLIGPLAEAKYVSLRDDETNNLSLVHVDSLHFYGGSSDLETIKEYVECFVDRDEFWRLTIFELFEAAVQFVNEPTHWRAITHLADVILADEKPIIEYDEIVSVLEQGQHIAYTRNVRPPESFRRDTMRRLVIESQLSGLHKK